MDLETHAQWAGFIDVIQFACIVILSVAIDNIKKRK